MHADGIFASTDINVNHITTCNCLGQNVTYECTAIGGAFTVWSGSAFMCASGEITLKHISLVGALGECNNGAIIAQGVAVDNNRYTSRLDVILSAGLVGRTVSCSVDTIDDLIQIGNDTLIVSTSELYRRASIH